MERASLFRKLKHGVWRKTPAPVLHVGVFRPLIRGCLGLGWVDFDAALEVGAVLDADARRGNISNDRAILLDVHTAAGMEIPNDFAINDHFAGLNFGIELGGGAHGQFVATKRDGALDLAVDPQVFGAGDMPFDCKASAQTCSFANVGVAEPSRRGAEWNNWRCCGLNWRSGGRVGCSLLLGPHTSSLNWCRNVVLAPAGGSSVESL